MYIARKQPILFSNNDILNPEALNENVLYAKQAIKDVADKEVYRWTSAYSFNPDVSTSITSATPVSYTEVYMPPMIARNYGGSGHDIVIESVAVTAYYQGTAPFTLIVNSQDPQTIEFPIRDASLATVPYDVVTLINSVNNGTTQATTKLLELQVPTGVTITKFDVTVGFSCNKYECGNLTPSGHDLVTKPDIDNPTYSYEFNDNSAIDAVQINTITNSYNLLSTGARKGSAARWHHVQFNNITSGSSSYVSIPGFTKASFSPLETAANVIGVYLVGHYSDTTATPADVVTIGWANNSGSFIANYFYSNSSLPIGSNLFFDGQAGFLTPGGPFTNTPNDPTTDRYIGIKVVTGSNMVIHRVDVYLILQ